MRLGIMVLVCACNSGGGSSGDAPHGDGIAPSHDGRSPVDSRADDAPGGTGEPSNLTGMTLYHNQVRAAVDTTGVAGGALPYVQWDPNLEALAAAWVAQCIDTDNNGLVDHSSSASRTNAAGYAYVGENIYAGSGPVTAHDAVFGTFGWQTEGAYYTYATNTCSGSSPSGTCGHYTQLVWRDTLHIGCALYDCPNLTYHYSVVCNYGPGGNIGNEQPY